MISASIVLYNTPVDQLKAIIDCYKPSRCRLLFLIDNSPSKSDYCIALSESNEYVLYLYNGSNLGYGAAHNIAIERAIDENSKYHIVINPDISFEDGVIEQLIEYADNNLDVVYILPKVIYPDGRTQYLCKLLPTPSDLLFRRFFSSFGFAKKRNDIYTLKNSGYNRIINPPCLSGCFMFLRVSTLVTSGIRFDDRFFMYCEDFDIIRRLHRVGKTIYYPMVEIKHDHANESYKTKRMLMIHIGSAIKYFNKYGWFFDSERRTMNKKILNELES